MGVTDAGIFGDILCARMAKRGVAALVTDGVVRDLAGVRRHRPAGLVRRRGRAALGRRPHLRRLAASRSAAAASPSSPTTSSWSTTTAPCSSRRRCVDEVVAEAPEQERHGGAGSWARSSAAQTLPGLYPMNAETKARYEADGG